MTRKQAIDKAVRRVGAVAFYRLVARRDHESAIEMLESSAIVVPAIRKEFSRLATKISA